MLIAVGAWAVVPPLAAHPASTESSPAERTKRLYESYVGNVDPPGIWRAPHRAKWFSPRMIALLEKDDACANGEIGLLDFDPIVWGQDCEITDVTTTTSELAPDRQRVTARFQNFGHPSTMTLTWIETKQGWRIDEIANGKETLSAVLSAPCG